MRGGPTPSTRRCLRTQVTRCEFYGALACEVDALVDTGSPATIVNEALATAAGLFAIEDADDEKGTTTTGLGGAATALRRCRAVWKSNLRPESLRRPPRHRRDACSIAWRLFTARRSQRGHVVAVHPTHWLISTQVDAPPVSMEAIDQAAELTKGKVAEGGAATDDAVKKAVVGPAQ